MYFRLCRTVARPEWFPGFCTQKYTGSFPVAHPLPDTQVSVILGMITLWKQVSHLT